MPIPNAPSLSKKIRPGAEGGHEFARIVRLLLSAEYRSFLSQLVLADDGAGDFAGADAILLLEDQRASAGARVSVAFQFKFYPSPLKSAHRSEVARSYATALMKNRGLSKWILVTPDDLNRHDTDWFEHLGYANECDPGGAVVVEHWGHTRLMDLFLRHPHIGARYYPDVLGGSMPGPLTIDRVVVDERRCAWVPQDADDVVRHVNWPEQIIDREGHITLDALPASRRSVYAEAHAHLLATMERQDIGEFPLQAFFDSLWDVTGRAPKSVTEATSRARAKAALQHWPGWDALVSAPMEAERLLALLTFHYWFGRLADPVLEVVLMNRSDSVQAVYSVGINVIEFFQELGGSAAAAGPIPLVACAAVPVRQTLGESASQLVDPIRIPANDGTRIRVRLDGYARAFPSTYTVRLALFAAASSGKVYSTPLCLCYPALPWESVSDDDWGGPARQLLSTISLSGA